MADYNQRLFSGGLRKYLHEARFRWLVKRLQELDGPCNSILEIGCFDGKVLNFLSNKPTRYLGFDANWEGGLDLAREHWRAEPSYSFHEIHSADEMHLEEELFDVALAMETLEHLPPHMLSSYLKKIDDHTNGYVFITVPNEIGIVFLMKWIVKKVVLGSAEHYSTREIINAVFGRCHLVRRHEHKGFDYRSLIKEVRETFEVVHISGIPDGILAPWLSFGVGIVAKSRRRAR